MTASPEKSVAIIIPARFASTRYPGKPLAEIRGAGGEAKSLIQRSWEAARRVAGESAIYVATDSEIIRDAAKAFGAEVIMTSEKCRNGTERCADVLGQLSQAPDIVVNLQGDAPLTPAYFVEALLERFRLDPQTQVATPAIRCTPQLYAKLVEEERAGRVGGTSALFSRTGRALYFSKRLIPYFDIAKVSADHLPVFLHIGVYAYRPRALEAYAELPVALYEQLEGLEQLRFLEANIPVDVVEVETPVWEMWELNNPSDLPHIEQALRVMGID